MKDRVGQVWEIDMAWSGTPISDHSLDPVVYIIVNSKRGSLRETDGEPSTEHVFLNTTDGSVSRWWERDAHFYEECDDRRRLA